MTIQHTDNFYQPSYPDPIGNTCSTCSFWKRGDSETVHSNHFGTCSHPAFIYLGDIPDSTRETQRPDSFVYWDSEDYNASFATGERFGCIHHSR